jgi:hypothetical protein
MLDAGYDVNFDGWRVVDAQHSPCPHGRGRARAYLPKMFCLYLYGSAVRASARNMRCESLPHQCHGNAKIE